jgi:hypothetical protein
MPGYTGFATGVLLYASQWIIGRRPEPKPEADKPTKRSTRRGPQQ